MYISDFEWDPEKEKINIIKHGVDFSEAMQAFDDPNRIEMSDDKHSFDEIRRVCVGKTQKGVLTVRYTLRSGNTRIIGAGYWRKGKVIYEKRNNLY